jgi:hypothetical protein
MGLRHVRIRAGLSWSTAVPFLTPPQLSQPAHRPLDARLGGILGVVGLGVLPPPAIDGIPELALQLFCPDEQAAPEELLRRGLDLFFCFSDDGTLFFDLLNLIHPHFAFFGVL